MSEGTGYVKGVRSDLSDVSQILADMMSDGGQKLWRIETEQSAYKDMLDKKLQGADVTYTLTPSRNNNGYVFIFPDRDLGRVQRSCNECYIEAGVFGQVSPEYIQAHYPTEKLHEIKLNPLEKEAISRELLQHKNVSMGFTALRDGTYKAIWLKDKDLEAEGIIRGAFAKITGEKAKEYKEVLDKAILEKMILKKDVLSKTFVGVIENLSNETLKVERDTARIRTPLKDEIINKNDPLYTQKILDFITQAEEPIKVDNLMSLDLKEHERKKRYPKVNFEIDEWLKKIDDMNHLYQKYLTASDTEKAAGTMPICLIDQAALEKTAEEISNQLNHRIEIADIKDLVYRVREYTQDMTVDEPSEAYNALEARNSGTDGARNAYERSFKEGPIKMEAVEKEEDMEPER